MIWDDEDCYYTLKFLFGWTRGKLLFDFLPIIINAYPTIQSYIGKGTCNRFVDYFTKRVREVCAPGLEYLIREGGFMCERFDKKIYDKLVSGCKKRTVEVLIKHVRVPEVVEEDEMEIETENKLEPPAQLSSKPLSRSIPFTGIFPKDAKLTNSTIFEFDSYDPIVLLETSFGDGVLSQNPTQRKMNLEYICDHFLLRNDVDCSNAFKYLFRWLYDDNLFHLLKRLIDTHPIIKAYVRRGTSYEFISYYIENLRIIHSNSIRYLMEHNNFMRDRFDRRTYDLIVEKGDKKMIKLLYEKVGRPLI